MGFFITILIGFFSPFVMAADFTRPVDSTTLKGLEGQWKFIGFSCDPGKDNVTDPSSPIDDTFIFNSDGTMNILIKKEDCEIRHTGIYTASVLDVEALSKYLGNPNPPVVEGKTLIIEYEEEIAYKGSCSSTPSIKNQNRIEIILQDEHFYLSEPGLSEDICKKGSGYSVFKKQ